MEAELRELLPIRRGHFVLASGHHGNLWLDLDAMFLRPRQLLPFVKELAHRLARHRIEAVVGPLVGGAFVAQAVAIELGVQFAFAENVTYRIPLTFHRPLSGKRVAIVDDAINAGSATRATYAALRSLGGEPVAAGALLLLGSAAMPFLESNELALEFIAALPNELWEPADCPLCKAGQPLSNPSASP